MTEGKENVKLEKHADGKSRKEKGFVAIVG